MSLTSEDVTKAVDESIARWDERRRREDEIAKEKTTRKEKLTNRVSIAAITVTMLMSFLGFARAERSNASTSAAADAERAKTDAQTSWTYYQTRTAERSSFQLADDNLSRQVLAMPEGDPRLRSAEVLHAVYASRVADIDAENRRVLFSIEDLADRRVQQLEVAARIERGVARYDMGTRVLTLAVVLLSVTLLANRESLFWVALAVATIGATIAIDGYFLVV